MQPSLEALAMTPCELQTLAESKVWRRPSNPNFRRCRRAAALDPWLGEACVVSRTKEVTLLEFTSLFRLLLLC